MQREREYLFPLIFFGGDCKVNLSFDRIISILFLLIGVGFIAGSLQIPETAYGSNVGPDVFPTALGVILILLSFRLFFETRISYSEKIQKVKIEYKRFLIIFISAILYVFFLEKLGYVMTTFLFLIIGFQVMEKGGWLKTVLIAGGFSLGIYFVFVKLLEGSLPEFPTIFY